MNAGGIVVLIAGVWLGVQVFGGDMLARLGIIAPSGDGAPTGTNKPSVSLGPARGPSAAVLNA